MNFRGRWGALDQGVLYFWQVAIPVTAFILLVIVSPHFMQVYKKSVKKISKNRTTRVSHRDGSNISKKKLAHNEAKGMKDVLKTEEGDSLSHSSRSGE